MFLFRIHELQFSFVFCLIITVVLFLFLENKISAQYAYSLDLTSEKCFELKEKNILNKDIASDNNNIFLSTSSGSLTSYRLDDGVSIWSSEIGGEIISDILLEDKEKKNLFVITKSLASPSMTSSTLRSISTATGLTTWQTSISVSNKVFLYNLECKLIFVDESGNIGSVNKTNGQLMWKTFVGDSLSATSVSLKEIIIVALTNKILFISALDGTEIFQLFVPSLVTTLSFSENKVYWGDEKGILHVYDSDRKKKLWKFQNGAAISHIISTSEGILVSSYDNFLYMLSVDNGKVRWKKRFPGRIVIKPLVGGSVAAITSVGSPELSVLDLRNGKLVNQISLEEENLLLSSPVIADNLLVLSTQRGIYTFSNTNEKQKMFNTRCKNRP